MKIIAAFVMFSGVFLTVSHVLENIFSSQANLAAKHLALTPATIDPAVNFTVNVERPAVDVPFLLPLIPGSMANGSVAEVEVVKNNLGVVGVDPLLPDKVEPRL